MKYMQNKIYHADVEMAVMHTGRFELFFHKKVLVLGASGLIGSFITDCFLYANESMGAGITVYAVSRDIEQLKRRFEDKGGKRLELAEADITSMNFEETFDYIIHAAGYGHPGAFRENPVEVLLASVVGTWKVLELAKRKDDCRVLYVSSGEAQEQINHLSARASYPMGKRAAETLCVSYAAEYRLDTVIVRPCHTFGAYVTKKDNRATAQFIGAAARGEDIEMYSTGEQVRSFAYVADCVSGILSALACGECGTVYGISTGESCSVREFAERCAEVGKCRVKMHMPNDIEKKETSPIRHQIIDNEALRKLGWRSAFSIWDGISRSIQTIHEMDKE